ncbi:hypothetical protein WJX72_005534 [[Myrmecia] bisecta]|uniref:enoyl-[acyl-carrier-protein] reductase n=1 Tax=[Myrmecia] bisecta TaxID=41462 RepID=A0AAW1R776_9CHLO
MAKPKTGATLYEVLGIPSTASDVEIRRAYRNLATRQHPDKGGDPEQFKLLRSAYDVLSSPDKREQYDKTGKVTRSVEEDFMEAFGGGNFQDKPFKPEELADQITVRQGPKFDSHSAGFEAWMRTRGDAGATVFTAESMAEQFGVVKGSYDAVALPKIKAFKVRCTGTGKAREVLELVSEALPPALEWGQVLVSMRAAPINPADVYTAQMGGTYGFEQVAAPFAAGSSGVGVVVKVGAGVTGLKENDWVIPFKTHLGTWQSLAVWKETDLFSIPTDAMPVEYSAVLRELCLAYRLLEDHAKLKPGDCVILNAANSTVGQAVIQLCALLRLRCVAVVRDHGDPDKMQAWLKDLGASEVVCDAGSIKAELNKLKFFAKPKLGLDAIGGSSAVRLSDALAEGGQLVIYGSMSGKAPAWPWQSWVFRDLQVKGYNLSTWLTKNRKKIRPMVEALAKLVNAGKLTVAYTEYELATEFEEALDHALDHGKNTKVLLRMNDLGRQYDNEQ